MTSAARQLLSDSYGRRQVGLGSLHDADAQIITLSSYYQESNSSVLRARCAPSLRVCTMSSASKAHGGLLRSDSLGSLQLATSRLQSRQAIYLSTRYVPALLSSRPKAASSDATT